MTGCASGSEDSLTISTQTKDSIEALIQMPPELSQASFLVARDCLRQQGYEVPYASAVSGNATGSVVGIAGLFPDRAVAANYGYSSTTKGELDPMTAFEASLRKAEQGKFHAAYVGTDDAKQVSITLGSGAKVSQSGEGCLAKANTEVYGSVKKGLQLANFVNEVYAQVDTDKVVSVIKKDIGTYEQCMAAAGYQVKMLNARDLAAQKFGKYRSAGDPPNTAEKTMVTTDADCQTKAGLIRDTNALFFDTAAAWITAHESEITARQEALTQAEREAKKIIDDA